MSDDPVSLTRTRLTDILVLLLLGTVTSASLGEQALPVAPAAVQSESASPVIVYDFPLLQQDAVGHWYCDLADPSLGVTYRFYLSETVHGRADIAILDSTTGEVLGQNVMLVRGIWDRSTEDGLLQVEFQTCDGTVFLALSLAVSVDNLVRDEDGKVLEASVTYVLTNLKEGEQRQYTGTIDPPNRRVTATSAPSYLEPLGVSRVGQDGPREFYFVLAVPQVAAGAAVVAIVIGTVAGAVESLDSDYDCSSWWSWWWDGCWWASSLSPPAAGESFQQVPPARGEEQWWSWYAFRLAAMPCSFA